MKLLGLAALSGVFLSGCFFGLEDLFGKGDWGTDSTQTQGPREHVFEKDKGTVFLADFNGRSVNAVSGDTGQVTSAGYPKSLFGKGLQMETGGNEKPICLFRNSAPLSLSQGSLEALIRTDSPSSGFNHIIDKSWLYGLSNYNGKVAVHFGGGLHGWWYTSTALPLESWTYLAVTFDGTTLNLYMNGVLAESTPNTGGSGSTAYDLGIGNASDRDFNIPFKGIIDEVRLSNVVRSGSEITKVWKAIEKNLGGK